MRACVHQELFAGCQIMQGEGFKLSRELGWQELHTQPYFKDVCSWTDALVLAKAMCGTGPLMEMSLLCPTARPQSFMWHSAIHRLGHLCAPQLNLQTYTWRRATHNLCHLCAPQLNLYVCVCASATDVSRKHDHLDESKPVIVGCMFTASKKHRLRKGNFHLVKQCPLTTTHLWYGLEQSKSIITDLLGHIRHITTWQPLTGTAIRHPISIRSDKFLLKHTLHSGDPVM